MAYGRTGWRADPLTRRGALGVLAALSAGALAGCDEPQPAAVKSEPGAPAVKIAAITVDASALIVQSSDATASWVQASLPSRLAHAFASNMAAGDPNSATLHVEIVSIALGTVGGAAGSIDTIKGTATLSGGGVARPEVTLSATTTYRPSPIDQSLSEEAQRRRVQALTQAFADWLPRKFEL